MEAAVRVFCPDVTYDDTAFPSPFSGRDALRAHLHVCAAAFPTSFRFVVDDFLVEEASQPPTTQPTTISFSTAATSAEQQPTRSMFVQWHVENNGVALPYTRGASFYTLNAQGLMQDGIDFVEPAGPLKPGPWQFWSTAVTALLREEPVRWVPLLSWVAYMSIVFLSDGILPGPNALALEGRTWEEVRDLSLNFFLVAPLLHLPFAPVVHPVLEGVFNGLLAWAALFGGFLSDDRRTKPNLFPMLPAVIGMQFLTSAFLLPYLTLRSSERRPYDDDNNETASLTQAAIADNVAAQIGENRILPVVLGCVGTLSLYWALNGRVDEFGVGPERWTSFWQLMSIDRVGSSFLVDLAIFGLFQGWLVDDDARRRGDTANPLLTAVAKLVPFFGLVAYLGLRPSLPESLPVPVRIDADDDTAIH
jgi:hypothetical protein